MKKTKWISIVAAASLLWISLTASVYGADSKQSEAFNIGSGSSGYKLNVFGFVDVVPVEGVGADGQPYRTLAIRMEKPERGSDGTYTLFEIETTDAAAHTLDAYPGIYGRGQIASFTRDFANGKVVYGVNDKFMDDIFDHVFTFPFMVLDKQGNYVNDFYDIAVVFVGGADLNLPRPAETVTAKPASARMTVNGRTVAFEAYSIEGNHYFKLRDLAMALNGSAKQFEVKWNEGLNKIDLLTEAAYTPVGRELSVLGDRTSKQGKLTPSAIYVDGVKAALTAYKIGGNNYVKLRDIAAVIDFAVTWEPESRTVGIDTSSGYTEE